MDNMPIQMPVVPIRFTRLLDSLPVSSFMNPYPELFAQTFRLWALRQVDLGSTEPNNLLAHLG
ncbi:MAG: hypothetical protein ACI945_001836 [Pseudohongiellaceae bacterium]|jgi:hypothetical protein